MIPRNFRPRKSHHAGNRPASVWHRGVAALAVGAVVGTGSLVGMSTFTHNAVFAAETSPTADTPSDNTKVAAEANVEIFFNGSQPDASANEPIPEDFKDVDLLLVSQDDGKYYWSEDGWVVNDEKYYAKQFKNLPYGTYKVIFPNYDSPKYGRLSDESLDQIFELTEAEDLHSPLYLDNKKNRRVLLGIDGKVYLESPSGDTEG